MVTDGQVRCLHSDLGLGLPLAVAARRAGMSPKTARHYRDQRTFEWSKETAATAHSPQSLRIVSHSNRHAGTHWPPKLVSVLAATDSATAKPPFVIAN